MNIQTAIVGFKKFDLGAHHATEGFDFQCHWSLTKLLDLYSSGNDFTMLLDHIDDAIIFENSNGQDAVDFIQLKKRDKKWYMKDLTRKKDGKIDCILSKMAKNYFEFEDYKDQIRAIFFISNQNFAFNSAMHSTIKFSDLTSQDQKIITDCIESICQQTDISNAVALFRFQETDLEPKNASDVSKSKITQFLNSIPSPIPVSHVEAFYQTLTTEIERKIRFKPVLDNFKSLTETKGVTRDKFEEYLTSIIAPDLTVDAKILRSQQSIATLNISLGFKKNFNNYSIKYSLESKKGNNQNLFKIVEVVNNIIDNLDSHELDKSIYESIDIIFDKFNLKVQTNDYFIEEPYLKTIIFIELHGKF